MITTKRGENGIKTSALECETLGNSSATFEHDAWGNLLPGSFGSTPFKWNAAAGYQHVPFTGLYHVGAREYDPRTDRWLQRDPIGQSSGDPNVYRYCGNDAVNLSDPSGLDWYYDQRTGNLYWDDPNNASWNPLWQGKGFAGKKGKHRNNPSSQSLRNRGPIPTGRYTIAKRREFKSDGITRLDNFPLVPDPGNNMHGRSHFLFHGGSEDGDPSQGCIIISKELLDLIGDSDDKTLIVYDSQNLMSWSWDMLKGESERLARRRFIGEYITQSPYYSRGTNFPAIPAAIPALRR